MEKRIKHEAEMHTCSIYTGEVRSVIHVWLSTMVAHPDCIEMHEMAAERIEYFSRIAKLTPEEVQMQAQKVIRAAQAVGKIIPERLKGMAEGTHSA